MASCRLWEGLGFKRIGRVPGAGKVLSSPGEFVDAIIYGRDLGSEGEDPVTQDRFDKIRYYLKHSKYPRGADRAEKSRLRSAATHYKLIEGDGEDDKLMLKDKEVVSDPQQQYEIAQQVHLEQHAGINKTTAAIAVKYHWVRIKETVSRVIRDCTHCKETLKVPSPSGPDTTDEPAKDVDHIHEPLQPSIQSSLQPLSQPSLSQPSMSQHLLHPMQHPFNTQSSILQGHVGSLSDYTAVPLDPQIMNLHMSRFSDMGYGGQHLENNVNVQVSPEYRMMVDEPDNTLLHDQMMKYQYVAHDDDLDFS